MARGPAFPPPPRPLISAPGHYEPYYIDPGYPAVYAYPPTVMMGQPVVYAPPPTVTYVTAPPPVMAPPPTMVTTYTTTTGPPPPPQVISATYTTNTTTTSNPVMVPGQPMAKPPGSSMLSPRCLSALLALRALAPTSGA